MSDDANILRPRFGKPRPTLAIDHEGDAPSCSHDYVFIQPRRGIVVCRNKHCRLELDAIDVLERLCRDWQWATHWSEAIHSKEQKIESLKREERRLKARVKRLRQKDSGVDLEFCRECYRDTARVNGKCLGCDDAGKETG